MGTLHLASRKGHIDVVELFLVKGFDTNLKVKNGQNSLHLACPYDHKGVAELFIEKWLYRMIIQS